MQRLSLVSSLIFSSILAFASVGTEREWKLELPLEVPGTSLKADWFKSKNIVVCLMPIKTNLYATGNTEITKDNYKDVVKSLIRLVWETQDPNLVGGYVFISNERSSPLFYAGKNKNLTDMREEFSRGFREVNLQYGNQVSDADVEQNTERFLESVTFVHDPNSESWKKLPEAEISVQTPAVFLVQPGGKISHSFTKLMPDEIRARADKGGTLDGADKSAFEILKAIQSN